MRFRASSTWPALPHHVFRPHHICHPAAATFYRAIHATPSGSSGGGGGAQDNYLLVPGATMATILMLGILHARRLYNDKKACVLSFFRSNNRIKIFWYDEVFMHLALFPGMILSMIKTLAGCRLHTC